MRTIGLIIDVYTRYHCEVKSYVTV